MHFKRKFKLITCEFNHVVVFALHIVMDYLFSVVNFVLFTGINVNNVAFQSV